MNRKHTALIGTALALTLGGASVAGVAAAAQDNDTSNTGTTSASVATAAPVNDAGTGARGRGPEGHRPDPARMAEAIAKATGKSTEEVTAALQKLEASRPSEPPADREAARAEFESKLAAELGVDASVIQSARPAGGERGPDGGQRVENLASALGRSTDEVAAAFQKVHESRPATPPADREAARAERDTKLAEALGVSTDQLAAAQDQAMVMGLQNAVSDGRLTQDQADQVKSLVESGDREGAHKLLHSFRGERDRGPEGDRQAPPAGATGAN